MNKIKAIFVSHEHSDHIRGVPMLAKKYKLRVYITNTTLQHCYFNSQLNHVLSFEAHKPVIIGGLCITAFTKFHDAAEPHSFIVDCNNIKVGVFTDIGKPCKHLTYYFKQCHAAFLEANYDEELLDNGRYPIYLKKRIRGGQGHLSNTQALNIFNEHKPPFLSHLILSHLSKNNNCPQLVHELFANNSEGTQVIVASRDKETPVYKIGVIHAQQLKETGTLNRPVQISLF
jgi:phosphoribosyl 1,2-cyclic phosphodiesterase